MWTLKPTSFIAHRLIRGRVDVRLLSSKGLDLPSLPFNVTPNEAMKKFDAFCSSEQITPLLAIPGAPPTTITPVFLPYYVFNCDVRMDGNQTTRVNGVIIYAGHSYRRILTNRIYENSFKSSSTIGKLKQFDAAQFLKPLDYQSPRQSKGGQPSRLEIFPDPWKSHRSICWKSAMEKVERQASLELTSNSDSSKFLGTFNYTLLGAQRVYLPAFSIEYTILDETYRSFVPGSDKLPEAAFRKFN
jgi:hypothetical protein